MTLRYKLLIAAPVVVASIATILSPFHSPRAATATATFGVTATVQATCLLSASSLAFGTYTGTQTDATTTISVTCTDTTTYEVGLDAGTAPGATVTTRRMTGPSSSYLGYGLYSDAARTANWGATAGVDTVAGTGNGTAQSITVYGRIPAAQFVRPGSYTDTITATVTY